MATCLGGGSERVVALRAADRERERLQAALRVCDDPEAQAEARARLGELGETTLDEYVLKAMN